MLYKLKINMKTSYITSQLNKLSTYSPYNYDQVNKDIDLALNPEIVQLVDSLNPSSRVITKEQAILALSYLSENMTPEGWQIMKHFMNGARGLNRWWILRDVYSAVKNNTPINSSVVTSYANSELKKLFETGDLQYKRNAPPPIREW